MDYRKCASEILAGIGGKENLVSAAHCATRLRLVIADNSKMSKDTVENTDGVKGVFESAGQIQIIIGTGTVNKVYDEFIDLAGVQAMSKEDVKQAAASKAPIWKRILKTLGDIFVPIIPAIVATGLLCGLLGGLSRAFPDISEHYIYRLLDMFSNAALTFLPILIAVSAAKIFKGNVYLGAVIGMIMIHPNLINAWSVASGAETTTLWSWFGLWNIQDTGYQGHVIPVVIAVWLMCKLENWLHKHVPEMIDLFVTPLVTVLVTGFVTMTVIGPVFAQIETWVLTGAQWLITIPFGIGAFLMGAAYAPTVVAGVHHMYNAIEASMIANNGQNIWMPIATAANVAQGAAALAVALKTKDKKIKSMALPASLSAFLGITEPAIFGVNVRFIRPFIAGMIGGAVGAAAGSIMNVYATAYGVTGLFGFLITMDCTAGYLIDVVLAAGVAFAVSWFMGIPGEAKNRSKKSEPALAVAAASADNNAAVSEAPISCEVSEKDEDKKFVIASPVKGKLIALNDVPDETFAQGILGQGAAVIPSEGKVVAPADGEISSIFDTKHAVGITLENGVEILVHVGINTVEMNGEGFEAFVKEGDKVKKGQKLVEFSIDKIKEAGYKTETPIIITNTDDYASVEKIADDGDIDALVDIIKVSK
ncbi:PTS system, sucrose-specific IIC component [Ruminococcaceae bacterium YRB3002]|jgi:PTS system sucrose-specific IIC component|nr:PTS system, sucrose-specific IIC component [Ruminococcaceae bacterium YRB3002]